MLFYFVLSSFFFFEIFTSLSRLFRYEEQRLHKKVRLVSKLQKSQAGQQIISRHILSYILRSEVNQALKFLWLLRYNVKNIFLQKP